MARAGTVAVLLPGATLTLRETHVPPIAAMREQAGVLERTLSDQITNGRERLLALVRATH